MRRYSMVEKAQNKSDGLESRGDEPMTSTEGLCAKSSVIIASEQLVLDTDPSAFPIPIAVIESSVDDDSGNAAKNQGGARERRRHTGKTIKSSSRVAMPFLKIEPIDLAEAVVPGSSCSTPESLSRSAEEFASTSPLHPAECAVVLEFGISDYVLLYFSLVTDGVLQHGYLADFINGTFRLTFIGQEFAHCCIYF